MNLAATLQLAAAVLAALRAVVASALLRRAALLGFRLHVDSKGWLLALVLWADLANDGANWLINAWLPPPNGLPLVGLARAAAHVGLAFYAAWVCAILGFMGWLAQHRLPKITTFAAVLWLSFVVANVLFYHSLRGEVVLRALGLLHIVAFALEVPCLVVVAFSLARKLDTERICGVFLVFLSLAAGIGPLRPREMGPIDRAAAEQLMSVATTAMYGSIIATILVGGVRWIRLFSRYGRARWSCS